MKLTLKTVAILLLLAITFLLAGPFTNQADAWHCWAMRAGAVAICVSSSATLCAAAWLSVRLAGC